jgi:hypothetical protein
MAHRLALLVAVLALAIATPASATPPLLQLGSHGARVTALCQTLAGTGFLPASSVTDTFDQRTWHAVVAFQGWNGLVRDGIVGRRTRAALRHATRPQPWSAREGLEVHVPQQVLLLVRHGRVQRAIHVSTGAGGRTPLGFFRVFKRERLSWSAVFHVWMPYAQYFFGGYALHEYPDVPAYPASHGCVRVPAQEVGRVWRFGRVGMRLWTTGR